MLHWSRNFERKKKMLIASRADLKITFQRNGEMGSRHWVPVLAAIACTVTIGSSAFAKDHPAVPHLAVVTIPNGSSREAGIAKSLVPDGQRVKCKLSPIGSFLQSSKFQGETPIEHLITDTTTQAKEAALAFDLVQAAQLKRQAADALLNSELLITNPSLVASYLTEAGAASVDAKEGDLATAYFRKALAVDADTEPGPTISPESKQAFEASAAMGPAPLDIPADRIFWKLSADLEVAGILWISVGRDEGGVTVSEKLYITGGHTNEPIISHRPGTQKEDIEKWIAREKVVLAGLISQKLSTDPIKKPWYKRWWVYAAVGGVLIAGAAGVAIGVSMQQSEVDLVVHH